MKKRRPKRGVLVRALRSGDGSMRITLDDVVMTRDDSSVWVNDCFVTSKDYDEKLFDDLNFDEKELAGFGYYILARLHAFKEGGEI